ncbi:hypothetical protein HKX48_003035 [Thoreauomyces humboldtii]|nr:hypothetical protein HKX48_003035 [Thoreauomyces humboldtii]
MPARGVLDSPNNSIVPKQRDELHVLRQAFSYVPKPSSSPLPTPNTTHHSIHVPLLDDIPEPGVELVQDVETTVMEVRHFVRLQVTYRLRSPEARPSGSDVDTDLEVEAEIELPIVLYEAPSESTSCDTEAAVLAGAAEDESPLASGGGFVEEDEEEEEPPAYVDTGRPPVYSGDGDQGGVRRRRF